MALTADLARKYMGPTSHAGTKILQASATVYQGTALAVDALGAVDGISSGDPDAEGFGGFALEYGDTATGRTSINVAEEGLVLLTVTGSGSSAPGDAAYASDDDTFTMTSTDNLAIGVLYQQTAASSTSWWVSFKATGLA